MPLTDNYGSTALMLAAERDNFSCVEFLVSRGADVYAVDINGMTALMLAKRNGHWSCEKFLFAKMWMF